TTSPEMTVDLLYEEKIDILMACDHPLTNYKEVPHTELLKYPQVVFKDGYGMQRLLQEWCSTYNLTINAVMELNTLDAFRGVVRQGEMVALLPETALVETKKDSSLAVRPLVPMVDESNPKSPQQLTRQVVLVSTSDRINIPPIAHFCHLVRQQAENFNDPTVN
ncbi:MAG: substrate-binding domain-containing protein, partial [Rhizobiales bacterium]|nr:substrate-binding domain-containing protein [Hyphomicrobiales bacterium]